MANLGSATNLVSGTLTVSLPPETRYWWIQNQDIQPLLVTFPAQSGFSAVALGEAQTLGGAGDWISSIRFPFWGPANLVLTSSVATAQFGSGFTTNLPLNSLNDNF